jgi:PAS domain-containing protein
VRFAVVGDTGGGGPPSACRHRLGPLAELLASAPDAFVVSDTDGQVVSANRAFLDLAQLGDPAQAVGRP